MVDWASPEGRMSGSESEQFRDQVRLQTSCSAAITSNRSLLAGMMIGFCKQNGGRSQDAKFNAEGSC